MDRDLLFNLVGWSAATVLLATIVQQVRQQWKSGNSTGVSPWLFIGQSLASLGFAVYSFHTRDWIFFSVNVALLVSELVGQGIYLRNMHRRKREQKKDQARSSVPAGAAGS